MEIIDAHAHIYPSKIAEKATKAIGEFYDISMQVEAGTTDRLLTIGKQAGISKFVIHSCATKQEQVLHINDFIKSEMDKCQDFIGFMTLHQDMKYEDIEKEVDRCLSMGFKGIKLHPDFQRFNIDSEEALKIYQVVQDKLPILFHIGDDRVDFSHPNRLVKVAKQFKNTKFIAAHFGGYRMWDKASIYKGIENIFFDTCSSLMFIDKYMARDLINMLGEDKFFFGTDFPMWNAAQEIERVDQLPISDNVKEKIYAKNFKRFLNI